MSDFAESDASALRTAGAGRLIDALRGIVLAPVRLLRDRSAARAARRDLYLSDLKLTDDMERQITARLTGNRSFRP
ncbi:hypothetical protein [Pseudorhodoplanes sp.]|jgi:hypothetical protein|uniref:hypothetical protein n=1 Tax=Pseudorhodoplanes sp. TaxID=1934341 RepID=UPI002C30C3D4|nr:hypothetical protein [Pseudorhodoplanes sp.]HWV42158.1 hypothetical protein [Pseudorhodoplanes sp.]